MINNPDELDDITDKLFEAYCSYMEENPEGSEIPRKWGALRRALLISLPAEVITYLSSDKWCFVYDNKGHWYRVPVRLREEFYEWADNENSYIAEEDLESAPSYNNFKDYKCMHPVNYMFKEILVLKEKDE